MDRKHEAEDPPGQSQRLTALLTTVGAVLGLIVSVAALNVDRSWRLIALGLGVIGILVVLASFRLHRGTLARGSGIGLLVVAGLVLVVSPAPSAPAPPQPRARLTVSQLLVSQDNQTQPATAKLDITVHNLGKRLAVLTGLRLVIRDFAYLPDCYTQGEIDASTPYPLALPDHPAPGTEVRVPLHEEVGPDQVDRFVVDLHPPAYRTSETGGTQEASFGYRVRALLSSDVQKDLPLGTAVFTAPGVPAAQYSYWNVKDPGRRQAFVTQVIGASDPSWNWNDSYERSVGTCLETNGQSLDRLLTPPGQRSDELAAVTAALSDN